MRCNYGRRAQATADTDGRARAASVPVGERQEPGQYGFDFGLWTRQIVRERIAQRFEVTLSLASVGALLAQPCSARRTRMRRGRGRA